MTDEAGSRAPWEPAFLAALSEGKSVEKAAKAAGVTANAAYFRRRNHAHFAEEWVSAQNAGRALVKPEGGGAHRSRWKEVFLEGLAETSNVKLSAARVNVPTRTVYKMRRDDPAFAAQWRTALGEGYDNLEMELLGYLRDPQPERKMDVASALRLLAAHRETVARERALREDDDEEAVLESIDAFIEEMRQRRAANTAILIEADAADGEE